MFCRTGRQMAGPLFALVCFGSIFVPLLLSTSAITSADLFKPAPLCDYRVALQMYEEEEVVIRQELHKAMRRFSQTNGQGKDVSE